MCSPFPVRFFHHPAAGIRETQLFTSLQLQKQLFPSHSPAAYASLLLLCSKTQQSLSLARALHALLFLNAYHQNTPLQTNLISTYANCGDLQSAHQVFNQLQAKNVRSFNALIRAHVNHGSYQPAISSYSQMLQLGLEPDNFTFPFVLKACADIGDLKTGKQISDDVKRSKFRWDVYVCNSLIGLNAKCGDLEVALQVFDEMPRRDRVSWTTMVSCFVQKERWVEAMELFGEMGFNEPGFKPCSVTVASVLPACASLKSLRQGKEIHCYTFRAGFDKDVYVSSALSDMYAKSGRGDMSSALRVFDEMPQRNVVSWNGMLAGYNHNELSKEAIEFFRRMDLKPNWVTLVNLIPCCARLAALRQGKELHCFAVKNVLHRSTFVSNALIDMYCKCGSLTLARQLFELTIKRDVITWTAMIAGYGMYGDGKQALQLFWLMIRAGIQPDYVTFVGVLSACSHCGLLDQGLELLAVMKDYSISPRMEHHACIVDLLGRAGRFEDAVKYIEGMQCEPSAVVWGALLAACNVHKNVGLGERVAEKLFEIEPGNAANYVLLSNLYAEKGRWGDVARVRVAMRNKGLKKKAGSSWIEGDGGRIHEFMSSEIYEFLEKAEEREVTDDTDSVLLSGCILCS